MADNPRVLHVCSDDVADGRPAESLPTSDGLAVVTATTLRDALTELSESPTAGVVCEQELSGGQTGLDVLEAIRRSHPSLPVVLSTAVPDGTVAAAATRLGVTEYVPRSEADPIDRIREIVVGQREGDDPARSADGGSGRRTVTGHRERDLALRENNEALRRLTRLATRDGLTETETIRHALEIGTERLGLPLGYLSRIEDGTQEVTVAVGDHPVVRDDAAIPLKHTYCERVVETGEPLAVVDATAEGWGETPAYDDISCYLGSPVTVGEELYGTLCFADTGPRSRSFSETERAFIELLVEWVGRELERRRREAELERYADIIEAVDDGVYALDDEGNFEFVNGAMTALTGYAETELLGSHTGFIKTDAVVERAETVVREMVFDERDDEATFELEIQRADDESFPAEDHMTLLYDDGEFAGTAGVIRDIAEQKRRDEALSGLLDTTRSLMQARTPEAVARLAVAATRTDLGFERGIVRLYDEETETLTPAAANAADPERRTYDADEGFPGEAFQRSETVLADDLDAVDAYDSGHAKAAMYVPLGEYGVLTVAATERSAFDDTDVSVAELLASNVVAALDRVYREQDLLRYESVIENVRDMVYVLDDEGRFQLVTDQLAEWLGFEPDALLGEHPLAVMDERAVATFDRRIRDLRGSDEADAIKIETTLETAGGDERPAEIEVSLLDGDAFRGTVGVVRDLTELKRARAELEDERDRFSYLFNSLPDAVVETETDDGEPVVNSVNPAFTDVFGFDSSAAVGEPLNELLVPPGGDGHDEVPQFGDGSTDGEPLQAELRLLTASGFRDFLFRGVPYSREDDHVRGFGIYTDITEQRERERRLKVLNRVLRHNLRNDLTVVLGLVDVLEDRIDDPELLSLLDRLERKATAVASISDRAREIERAVRRDEDGSEPVDVTAVVRRIADAYRERSDGGIETTTPEEPAPAADGRFHRVLSELLENSIEHAGDEPTISVDVRTDRETVRVTVADDGPGIPDHELDVVTGDEPITQLRHGSGLGLWLVIWVTETYGGTVSFDETADGGAAVTLRLPRTDD